MHHAEPMDIDVELGFDGSYLLIGDTTKTHKWPDDLQEMPEELVFLETLSVSIKVAHPLAVQGPYPNYGEADTLHYRSVLLASSSMKECSRMLSVTNFSVGQWFGNTCGIFLLV